MKEVVVIIQPFVFEQHIHLLENGNLRMKVTATMQDLAERVFKVAAYDEVTEVVLKGNVDFTAKIKEEIRDRELTEYGEKKLNIILTP